ncbi:MAG: hypothetical protein JRE28_12630 [Deltaproteobacteria bacterium]|nr:hypothetical protein [Deltaproteobacteria bacterium]
MNHPETRLKTWHTFWDFLYWNLAVSVPLIAACVAIAEKSLVWLFIYIIACISLVMVIYRFYCIHCPHYHQSGKTLKCMFFWWMPKIFKAESVPLKPLEKTVSVIALLVIIMLPVYWLLLRPGLLVIYLLSMGVLGLTLRRYECKRCVYFQCPSNCVPEKLKK